MKKQPDQIDKRFWDKTGNKVTYSTGEKEGKPKLWLVRKSMMGARAAACILWCEMRIDMELQGSTVWMNGKAVQPSAEEVLESGRDPKEVGLTTDRERKSKRAKAREAAKIQVDATSVDELIAKLRASTDKSEKRKIRGMLRKAGHTGGLAKAPKPKKVKKGRRAKKGKRGRRAKK
jgi:hypothetical protein